MCSWYWIVTIHNNNIIIIITCVPGLLAKQGYYFSRVVRLCLCVSLFVCVSVSTKTKKTTYQKLI